MCYMRYICLHIRQHIWTLPHILTIYAALYEGHYIICVIYVYIYALLMSTYKATYMNRRLIWRTLHFIRYMCQHIGQYMLPYMCLHIGQHIWTVSYMFHICFIYATCLIYSLLQNVFMYKYTTLPVYQLSHISTLWNRLPANVRPSPMYIYFWQKL